MFFIRIKTRSNAYKRLKRLFLNNIFLGTTWKGSTIEMQFRLGNAFKQDLIVEAELIVTSKQGSLWMSRKYNASVYLEQSILAPNGTRLLDSHAFPRRANVEFGLNVTRAVKAWTLTTAKTYRLQVKLKINSIFLDQLSGYRARYISSPFMPHSRHKNSSHRCPHFALHFFLGGFFQIISEILVFHLFILCGEISC